MSYLSLYLRLVLYYRNGGDRHFLLDEDHLLFGLLLRMRLGVRFDYVLVLLLASMFERL